GLCMMALITLVTYAWPTLTSAVGCSLISALGTIQATAGRSPLLALSSKLSIVWMLTSSLSSRTVVNNGSGFQMLGVDVFWGAGGQSAASSSQSGSEPSAT